MAINALQVAWLSRLAMKGIIRKGDSIIEFGPQDLICSRRAVEIHAHLNPGWSKIDEIYDGEKPRPVKPAAFYELFGIAKYRSVDATDARSDWLHDLNEPFRAPELFDVATNFGTFEHVFNIAAAFRSIHDALRSGGVALHVLPAFADIDHGFFNIHPTTYFDLAAANGYEIEDFCYFDRWDIRNRVFEADLRPDHDFESLPIGMETLRDPGTLKELVSAQFVKNYQSPETRAHCSGFPGRCFDYCLVALRKTSEHPFQNPMQGLYAANKSASHSGPEKKAGVIAFLTQPLIDLARKYQETKGVFAFLTQRLIDLARKYLPSNVKSALRRVRSRWKR
jgi:SAM-dependent methyltransferase